MATGRLRQRLIARNTIDQPMSGQQTDQPPEETPPNNSDLPGVSYVIPCYNHGQFVEEAILSCLGQHYPGPKQVLLVDDGSTDPETQKVIDIIQEFWAPDVQVYKHQENRGLAAARNTGFSHADYEYVIPLDADDKLAANYTIRTLHMLLTQRATNPNLGFVYTDVRHIGAKTDVWTLPTYSKEQLLKGPYIVCTSLMCHSMWREVYQANGQGYDEHMSKLGGWEDYLFYLEAALLGWIGMKIPGPLFLYRKHAQNTGGSMVDKANENVNTIKAYIQQKIDVEYGVAVL